jgi:SAM-dependent methyltransferase
MEIKEYAVMYESEDRHWWYRSLHDTVLKTLNRQHYPDKGRVRLLDAGCGTGGMLTRTNNDFDGIGIDMSAEALEFCKKRKLSMVAQGDIQQLPFKDETFHNLISLDVLCHCAVNSDLSAIGEFHRVLKPRGILILNLPAYDWLRSKHDKAAHTGHRYGLSEVYRKVAEGGFTVKKITYRNSILFPFVMIIRLAKKAFYCNNNAPSSDLKKIPAFFNNLFFNILKLEDRILEHINLPFGLSIFCIAQK